MDHFFRRRSLLVLAVLFCGSTASSAEPEWPVQRGPSREPVPYHYDAGQWQKVPREFLDDAPACLLYSGISYLLEPDGAIETISHEITRLNSRKAIQELGEYRSIVYNPAYEKLTLNVAQVRKADGRCVPVGPRHVQLRDMGTDFLVYDTSKQLVISYPSLEVGDVLEVKWTTRGKNPEHQGQFFTRYTFGADIYPIVCDEMRLRLPKTRALKQRVTGGTLEPVIGEEGDQRIFHWKATNLPRLPTDDHLPSKEHLRLQMSCSTFTSWDEVFQWKQHIRKECWACTAEVRQVVQEVTRDLKTPLDKARALTYWVRRHIRYVSVGEKHDYTPHSPAIVLANRFGDCKDSTQLLAVMLREAGVPSALATLGVRDDGQVLEDVPSPWGTHAILLVPIDGVDHWVDTTASLSGWDLLPRDDRDRLCYVTDDKGLRLVRTPALKPEDNRTEQTTRVAIGPDGSTRSERTATYHGLAALQRRNDWVDVPAGERRRQLTAELQDANSKSRLGSLEIDEGSLKDYDKPVSARIRFDVLDQFSEDADRTGNREGNVTDSKVWGGLLWYNLDYDRTAPLELETPFESLHRYIVPVPPYFTLDSHLREREVHSRWGLFRLRIKEQDDPREVEIEYFTRVEKARIEPADFDAFRKFHDDVQKYYRVWMTLAPMKDPAQAPILEALLRLTPGDSAAAGALASLYLQNSQNEAARRVLRHALHYHPASARLGELAIKAAETLKDEEAAYRNLIRHHARELKYVVALGQNLIDQDKHADARDVLQSVLRKGTPGEQSLAYFQLARSSFLRDQAANALRHFEKAEDADPERVNSVAALRVKAGILEKMERPADAAGVYRDVLELDPDQPAALEALVRLGLAAGKRDEALDHLRRFSVVAKDVSHLARAADYHLRLERYEDAFDLAGRARELGGNALTQRTLGLVYLQRGTFDKAAFHLERADLDGTVLEGLIRSRLALGLLHRAVQDAGQVEKIAKPSAELTEVRQAVADLVKRRKAILTDLKPPPDKEEQWTEAIDQLVCAEYGWSNGRPAADVESLLKSSLEGADLGPAHGLRGVLALDKGRLHQALSDAERAVKLSPKEAVGHYVRGRVRLERGQADALADLRKAAELSERKDAHILHWLAAALFREGHRVEALALQRLAVQLKPKDTELTHQLQDFEKEAKPD